LTGGAAPVYLPPGSVQSNVENRWTAKVKVPRSNQ
jgi:hypothetical protein